MSIYLFAVLASVSAALLFLLGAKPHRRAKLVTSLHIETATMTATVGTAKPFTLSPKDAFGLPVDLAKFPSALTDVVWSVSDTALGSINTTKPDGTAAEFLPTAPGVVVISVNGKNKAGETLGESLSITIEEDTPLVKTLGLAEA